MDVIEINKGNINDNSFKNILFCMFAEGGAMGDMGAIYLVQAEGKLYRLNYIWGDVKYEEILDKFPPLAECEFGLFGRDSRVPTGWNYVDLGAGNHLMVHDRVYPEFKELIKDYTVRGKIYRDWISHADWILNNSQNVPRESL